MRIRSTKPEFWRSERIASVSWDARLVLKGLESFVDDNGVGRDDLALIVGDLFQRDVVREHSRTLARVSEAISALHTAGLIHRYEAEGTRLLYVSFWETVQRVDKPQPGRFPRPDGTFNYKDSIIRESSRGVPEASRVLAPGTGEQGNRGTGEQGTDITLVNETTYVREPSENEWDEAAREVGIEDLPSVRDHLQTVLGVEVTPFQALVFSQEFSKLTLNPVRNLGAYVVGSDPDSVRDFYANADLGVA